MRPLDELAKDKGLAVLLARHLTKTDSANLLYRGAGSVAIIGLARSALRVCNDPSNPDPYQHLLVQVKGSLAGAATLGYRTVMREGVITIEWLGERNFGARDLATSRDEDASALQEAMMIITAILSEGPVKSTAVIKQAKANGASLRTLRRAKRILGVKSHRIGNGPRAFWVWTLQDASSDIPMASRGEYGEGSSGGVFLTRQQLRGSGWNRRNGERSRRRRSTPKSGLVARSVTGEPKSTVRTPRRQQSMRYRVEGRCLGVREMKPPSIVDA